MHNWKSKYNRVRMDKRVEDADDFASKKDAKGDSTDKYDKYDNFPNAEALKKAKEGSAADHYDKKSPLQEDNEEPAASFTKPKWPAYNKEKVRVKKFEPSDRKPRYVDSDSDDEIIPKKLNHE